MAGLPLLAGFAVALPLRTLLCFGDFPPLPLLLFPPPLVHGRAALPPVLLALVLVPVLPLMLFARSLAPTLSVAVRATGVLAVLRGVARRAISTIEASGCVASGRGYTARACMPLRAVTLAVVRALTRRARLLAEATVHRGASAHPLRKVSHYCPPCRLLPAPLTAILRHPWPCASAGRANVGAFVGDAGATAAHPLLTLVRRSMRRRLRPAPLAAARRRLHLHARDAHSARARAAHARTHVRANAAPTRNGRRTRGE